jgi:hypothetical protein
MALRPITILVENGEVTIVDGDSRTRLGTVLPDDDALMTVIARAFDCGRRHKAREICAALGVAE